MIDVQLPITLVRNAGAWLDVELRPERQRVGETPVAVTFAAPLSLRERLTVGMVLHVRIDMLDIYCQAIDELT